MESVGSKEFTWAASWLPAGFVGLSFDRSFWGEWYLGFVEVWGKGDFRMGQDTWHQKKINHEAPTMKN